MKHPSLAAFAVLLVLNLSVEPYAAALEVPAFELGSDSPSFPLDTRSQLVRPLAGSPGVSSFGSATYTVPLELPPGLGPVPILALGYDSMSRASGYQGVGWSLSGLPSIRRCKPTVETDGQAGADWYVRKFADPAKQFYELSDRFCLNGQRLVAIDGEYGAADTEYRTENESFVKVVGRGQVVDGEGNELGPQSFEVWLKSGLRLELGGTPDSRVGASTGVTPAVHAWLVSRGEDRFGNAYTVTYRQSFTQPVSTRITATEVYPIRVDYAPDASVHFEYVDRTTVGTQQRDLPVSFVAGEAYAIRQLLTKISTFNGDLPVREYVLEYGESPTTGKLRLGRVSECGFSEVGDGRRCGRATVLRYQQGAFGFQPQAEDVGTAQPVTPGATRIPGVQPLVIDQNGDGFLDLFQVVELAPDRLGWEVALGDGVGFAPARLVFDYPANRSLAGTVLPMDQNNDGRTDFYYDGLFPTASPPSLAVGSSVATGGPDRYVGAPRVAGGGTRATLSKGAADMDADGSVELLLSDRTDIVSDTFALSVLFTRMKSRSVGAPNPTIPQGFPALIVGAPASASGSLDQALARQEVALFELSSLGDVDGDRSPEIIAPTANFSTSDGPLRTVRLRLGLNPGDSPASLAFTRVEASGDSTKALPKGDGAPANGRGVDLNGDGRMDWLAGVAGTFRAYLSIDVLEDGERIPEVAGLPLRANRHPLFDELDTGISSTGRADDAVFTDLDRDGIVDLLVPNPQTGLLEALRTRQRIVNGRIRTTFDALATQSLAAGFEDRNAETALPSRDVTPIAADIDADGVDELVFVEDGRWKVLRPASSEIPDLLVEVRDVLGGAVEFDYSALGDRAVYQALEPTPVPARIAADVVDVEQSDDQDVRGEVLDPSFVTFRGGMTVVSALRTSNGLVAADGIPLQNETRYIYRDARVSKSGRGFLGFQLIVQADLASGILTFTRYAQRFPFAGVASEVAQTLGFDTLLNRVRTELVSEPRNDGRTTFAFARSMTREEFEPSDGGPVRASVTQSEVDAFGNLTRTVTVVGESLSRIDRFDPNDVQDVQKQVETLNLFSPPSLDDFRVSFLTRSETIVSRVPGAEDRRIVSIFTEDGATLRVKEQRDFAGTPVQRIAVVDRDARGRVIDERRAGANASFRTLGLTRGFVNELFPAEIENALGQRASFDYDLRFGTMAAATGRDGLTAFIERDVLGDPVATTTPTGTVVRTFRSFCDADPTCPATAVTRTTILSGNPGESGLGAPAVTVYLDRLGREVRSEQQSLDGGTIRVDTEYDALGRVVAVSEPHFSGDAPVWTEREYDAVGRVVEERRADGTRVLTDYASDPDFARRTTRVVEVERPDTASGTSADTRSSVSVVDSLGQLRLAVDPQATTLERSYDALGNLSFVRVNGDDRTIVRLKHDLASNRTLLDDPDAGIVTSTYDGLGQVRTETDARGLETRLFYDLLGRLVRRTDADGSNYVWKFDDTAQGGSTAVGRMTARIGPGFDERLSYDAFGRVERSATRLIKQPERVFEFEYDGFDRDVRTVYPSGFAVEYRYNDFGYLAEIRDGDTGQLYQQILSQTARGQTQSELLGNGLRTVRLFDRTTGRVGAIQTGEPRGSLGTNSSVQNLNYQYSSIGVLLDRRTRHDGINVLESFSYDALDRLVQADTAGLPGGQTRSIAYGYDPLGNLTFKTGVGTYELGGGPSGPGVHAVTRTVQDGVATSYAYDASGNMVQSGDRRIAYTPFDKPSRIEKGDSQTPDVVTDFSYGPNRQRFRQVTTTPEGTRETLYVGDSFEEIRDVESGITRQKCHVGSLLVHTTTLSASGDPISEEVQYLHRDHLGSVEAITDEAGRVLERLQFAPFGERRENTQEDLTAATADRLRDLTFRSTPRGFTDHEHLDDVGLIHTGGRLYDPELGRFMSADLLVQAPAYTQSYNRYSYVLNSPLSLVDPSGFESVSVIFNPTIVPSGGGTSGGTPPISGTGIIPASFPIITGPPPGPSIDIQINGSSVFSPSDASPRIIDEAGAIGPSPAPGGMVFERFQAQLAAREREVFGPQGLFPPLAVLSFNVAGAAAERLANTPDDEIAERYCSSASNRNLCVAQVKNVRAFVREGRRLDREISKLDSQILQDVVDLLKANRSVDLESDASISGGVSAGIPRTPFSAGVTFSPGQILTGLITVLASEQSGANAVASRRLKAQRKVVGQFGDQAVERALDSGATLPFEIGPSADTSPADRLGRSLDRLR